MKISVKRTALLTALFCTLSVFAACAAAAPESPVAVQVGTRSLTVAEIEQRYNYYIDLYTAYNYGVPKTSRAVEKLQDDVIAELLEKKILLNEADKRGMGTLDDAQIRTVEESVDVQLEKLIAVYITKAKEAGTNASRSAAIRKLIAAIQDSGMDMSWKEYRAYLYEQYYEDKVLTLLRESVVGDITASDEELKDYYDSTLAEQQTLYAEADDACVKALTASDKTGKAPVLYVPEGIVRVRILKIADSSQKAQRSISAAYEELQGGAGFADVLAEYGEDSTYTNYPVLAEKGIPMLASGDDSYDEAVLTALRALEPGEYSEPILLADSCVIVNLVGAEPDGTVSFSDAEARIRATVLGTKQGEAWSAQKAVWAADTSEIVYYEDAYRKIGK